MALECPRKLYYANKKEYANQKINNSFLKALADSGLQVGELAKHYFPEGHNIGSVNHEESLKATDNLLREKEVIIFEGAIKYKDFFLRADIISKKGNAVELIEVKAKSYKSGDEGKFHTSSWNSYMYDIAFQKYIFKKAYPRWPVKAFLMLVDKENPCLTNGLFGKLKIKKDKNDPQKTYILTDLSSCDIKVPILKKVSLDSYVDPIISGQGILFKEKSFEQELQLLCESYKKDEKIEIDLGAKCKKCEFKFTNKEREGVLKDGFKECWREKAHFSDKDFEDQTVLDLYQFRGRDKALAEGKFKIKDLSKSDLGTGKRAGIQKIQIEKEKENDKTPYIDTTSLRGEVDKWTFPLHFIDFETSKPAIPFTKGRRPYEEVAFQFSHHTINVKGEIEHKSQYINTTPSFFPNFEFIRELKKSLSNDNGTIFRYWDHENTYLKKINGQLHESNEPDKESLIGFINSIAKINENKPPRCMVDLGRDILLKYYYSPLMKGSFSIKKVLPIILNESLFLRKKYSGSIYGTEKIKSLNFKNKVWIKEDNGRVINPYELLEDRPFFLEPLNSEQIDYLMESVQSDFLK